MCIRDRFFIDLVSNFATPMPLRVQYALSAVLKVLRFCITGALRTSETDAAANMNSSVWDNIGAPMASSPFKPDSVEVVKQVDYSALLSGLLEVLRVQSTSHDESVAINALHTTVPIMCTAEGYAEMLLREPELLSRLLVHNPSEPVRKATLETLFKLCERLPLQSLSVLKFVTDALQFAGPTSSTISEGLDLLALLLEQPEAAGHAKPLLRMLLVFVQKFPDQSEDESVLTKCLQLFADVMQHWPGLIHSSIGEVLEGEAIQSLDVNLAELALDLIWYKCLYGDQGNSQPKCATVESRDAAGMALLEIVKDQPELIAVVTQRLQAIHEQMPATGTSSWDYWYMNPNTEAARRPRGGYLGLRNQGLCCYQNSVLQQLYNVPEIRSGVLSTNQETGQLEKELEEIQLALKNPDKEDEDGFKRLKKVAEDKTEKFGQIRLLHQLQSTFAHLQFGVGTFFDPVKFVDACEGTIRLDHPVREQNDANDFFTKLCDQMDEALKDSSFEKLFTNHMKIETESEWSIEHNGERLSRPGPTDVALAINIEVENQKSLEESLALNFESEDGYELTWGLPDGTEKNCESTKTPRIKTAPKTLVFNLKRYKFSLETLDHVRCADYFEFPRSIDIGPYMIDGGTQKYTLSGVVIHEGSSGGGHYYSYARDRCSNKWFKFDDATVAPWDVEANLCEDTFGGTKNSSWVNAYGETKHWSLPKPAAYMLFYDLQGHEDDTDGYPASSPESSGSCVGDSLEQLQHLGLNSVSAAYEAVMEQNANQMRASHVCNSAHMKLVLNLLKTTLQADQQTGLLEGTLGEALQFFFSTVVRVGIRKWTGSSGYNNSGSVPNASSAGQKKKEEEAKKTPEEEAIEEHMNIWNSVLSKGLAALPSAKQQILEMQSQEIKRLLLECPHDYARKTVGALLIKACSSSQTKLQLFYKLLALLPEAKTTNAAQFGQILHCFSFDKEVVAYVRSQDVPARILHYILGPKSPIHHHLIIERGWGSRNYPITVNVEVFLKCLCALISPLDGLPELSRSILVHNTDVRCLILSSADLNSVKSFVLAVTKYSDQQCATQIGEWLAQAHGDDVNKTATALSTLLTQDEGSQMQMHRVSVALSALRRQAELACHQGRQSSYQAGVSYTNYTPNSGQIRLKKLVQILVECSAIGAVKLWIEQNKDLLVQVRQAMQQLVRETKLPTNSGTSAHGAKLQRTPSTMDAERALEQLIAEFGCEDQVRSRTDSDFEARVDRIHQMLQARTGSAHDSYEDKREWCVKAAQHEPGVEDAVDWILNNECSLNTADYTTTPSVTHRKRKPMQVLHHQPGTTSDDDIYGSSPL
eukprot:TRINITY_DN15923_c0_g1_i4.p1 TRINITY_DN15923_c0_g1~~TRINITY_DN15923_c0_g1_i4.p1  ORF type:complete len:1326 (+),score=401.48 TRINITY_DN15923_c0_g1_i4:171-4148(+)